MLRTKVLLCPTVYGLSSTSRLMQFTAGVPTVPDVVLASTNGLKRLTGVGSVDRIVGRNPLRSPASDQERDGRTS